jgi:hypothetical protein
MLLSVVAPSLGGGVIASEVVSTGEFRPVWETPAPADPVMVAAITVAPALVGEVGDVVGSAAEPPAPTVSELAVPAPDPATAGVVCTLVVVVDVALGEVDSVAIGIGTTVTRSLELMSVCVDSTTEVEGELIVTVVDPLVVEPV